MEHAAQPGNPDTVVIVPMYNEAPVVAEVLGAVRAHFARVVVIDDGSTDDSVEIARACDVRVIQHSANLGAGAALATGLDYALRETKAEFMLTFDSDGQHRPEDGAAMVGLLRGGDLDVVLGSRFMGVHSQMPAGRRLLLRAGTQWTRLTTRLPLTDTHNGLRAFTRQAAAKLDVRQPRMAYGSEVLASIARHRMRYREFPVQIMYTEYTLGKGQQGINAINILFDLAVAKVRLAR